MKHRILHIVVFLFLIQLFGCDNNDHPTVNNIGSGQKPGNMKEELKDKKDEPGVTTPIESRFQDNITSGQSGTNISEAAQVSAYEYYIPSEDIEKQELLPSGQVEHSGRQSEEGSGFGKNYQAEEPYLFKSGRTSREIYFTAVFDNDILDYTDYYYTNGISFELYHPAISASPLMLLLPGLRNSVNYYSLILLQNMYTPLKLENPVPLVGDRPFAAYLLIGHHKVSLSSQKHRRLETELDLGAIGPAALGGLAQDAIHSNEPVGWVNQVRNDVVVNYSIRFDQGLYSGRNIELAVTGGGQAGTLYDNIMAGVYFQAGRMNDRYGSVFQTTGYQKPFKNRVRYYFSLDIRNKLIIYDATLQGGMFNHESVYKLDGDQLKRYIFTGTASVGIGLGRYSLELDQVFLTPEFDGGRHHLWLRIRNIFYLN
jgi:hypothetical protein